MPDHVRLKPSREWPMRWLRSGGLAVAWLPGGTLRGIWRTPEGWASDQDVPGDALRINGLLGDPTGGGPMRLLIRTRRGDAMEHLCDALREASEESFTADAATWRGTSRGLAWTAQMTMANDVPGTWAWRVRVDQTDPSASAGDTWDAILVQDLALASEAASRNNEKYVGQYLDLKLIEDPAERSAGPRLIARQGLPQPGGVHPALFAGAAGVAGVTTDLLAFYGTAYKSTGRPALANAPQLPTGVIQHETPAAVLQARPCRFGDTQRFVFHLQFDHPQATGGPEDRATLNKLTSWASGEIRTDAAKTSTPTSVKAKHQAVPLRSSEVPDETRLETWFGPRENWRHVERDDTGRVLSFFYGRDRHVATRLKDDALRRGHGHILRTGRAFLPDDHSVCCTTYQHGVFASQLTVGNTTFGQLCSIVRDPINLNRAAGLRLWLDEDGGGGWTQLGQAGAFEMAPGWCRWWYVLDGRVIRVSAAACPDAPTLRYEAEVTEGQPVRFAVRQHTSIGEIEDGFATDVAFDAATGTVTATPASDAEEPPWIARVSPSLSCKWRFDEPDRLQGFAAGSSGSTWGLETEPVEALRWTIAASPDGQNLDAPTEPFDTVRSAADVYWTTLHERVSRPVERAFLASRDPGLARLRDAVPWMAHSAMIHLSVPHGLEQFGGAAWGTRDVCQGPTEMLRAIGRSDVLADVLRVVFRHQHVQTGDWPQWFMHPPFHSVQAADSHGDVVIWPLYALAHFLEMGGDPALLDEPIAWTDREAGFAFTEEHDPIRVHAQRAIERVVSQRIPGTALPRYGHGDWNDALQPTHPGLAERLVSAWTAALLADTLHRLADALRDIQPAWSDELAAHAAEVRGDFAKWCMPADPLTGTRQIAGLILFDDTFQTAEPILHPADARTGIRRSLIPMNRALLAGLLDGAQADHHRRVIDKHLLAPDGVRLMERPPAYTGGTTTIFQRAESAAFFGREVGLMYTHAHLRTVETMIVAGQHDAALQMLNRVNPVGLTDREAGVANAAPRQANAYFSSSDARFATRCEADARHADVYTGGVVCDGGWRIYSSGPGIFLGLVRRVTESLR
ncbi:MAG: hypothetical protein AAGE65_02010 [Planctomycetota bacterium]